MDYFSVAVKSQNLPFIYGGAFIATSNNEANDFPVFCADNYPVDPSKCTSVSGRCKDCNIAVYVQADYLLYENDYYPVSNTFGSWSVICEDL
jgi:hypothetical protein